MLDGRTTLEHARIAVPRRVKEEGKREDGMIGLRAGKLLSQAGRDAGRTEACRTWPHRSSSDSRCTSFHEAPWNRRFYSPGAGLLGLPTRDGEPVSVELDAAAGAAEPGVMDRPPVEHSPKAQPGSDN